MGLKTTVKEFCPNIVLSLYGSIVTTVRKSPEAPRQVFGLIKSLGSRLEEAKLRRKLFSNDAPMVPPMRIVVDGSWSLIDYKNVGEEAKELFIKYANLKPDSSILDLGCGIGRCAIPLTHYINNSGKYLGLDVDAKAIDWCTRRVTKRYPNFLFEHLDVYSNNYNPNGKMKGFDVQLPCQNAQFDVIVAMSLFSHMTLDDTTNYLAECHRILKPSGKVFFTCFILNDESRNLIRTGKGLQLIHPYGSGFVLQPEAPETAIGHAEKLLFNACENAGFKKRDVYSGSWCGRENFLSYQDIIVCAS